MDAKKYYEMADLALCEKTAYSHSVASAAAQISIAISLHRIAESLEMVERCTEAPTGGRERVLNVSGGY